MAAVNGDVIRKARLQRGLTQQEVAIRCAVRGLHMDDSRIAKIELGRLGCSPRVLPVLAEVLGLQIDDMLRPVANGNRSGGKAAQP